MNNYIISFAIKNKFFVSIFVMIIVGWGVYSMFNLAIDAVPDITDNQVQVITVSPSLATQEVEKFITRNVELAMANLPGVLDIRSISRFGLSVVTIVFEERMGTYLPRQLVSEKIKEAEEQIPERLGKPSMGPITTGLGEIYQYLVIPKKGFEERYTITDLRTIQDWIIKRQLTGIPGVVEINSWGGKLKQFEVSVKPERLSAMNISILEILEALQQNNQNTGASYVEKTNTLYFVRGEGILKTYDDIKHIIIKKNNGIPITIGDVADVGTGSPKRYGATTYNGKGEAVSGIIMMLKGENSAEVVKRVKERIDKIKPTLPEGIEIKPYIDRTKLVNNTTKTVVENLSYGGLIVVFVLVLLLGNVRSGLVVASIIPLAMFFALGLMHIFGVSANLMSLGALDFGIIVDGAVIIVESTIALVVSKSHEVESLYGDKLKSKIDEIVTESSSKMMNSAFFGQIIILIVFIPIVTLTGVEGKMFRPMALTFGFAVLGAMIMCFTYVPMVSSIVFRKGVKSESRASKTIIEFLNTIYLPLIKFVLNYKKRVVYSAVGILIITVYVFLNLGGEFIPQLEEGDFALETRAAPGTSLSQTIKTMTEVEKILKADFPEVIDVVTKIGAGDIPTDPMPIEGSDIMIHLKQKNEWVTASTKDELFRKMEEALEILPGVNTEFSQPIEMRFNELMTGIKQDIAVKIFGEDLNVLQQKGLEAAKIINSIRGAGDVKIEQVVGLPQLNVRYNREKLARYGLNISDLNKILSASFSGEKAGLIYENERSFDLVVRLQSKYRDDIESINSLYVKLDDGEQVPLKELAQISFDTGPAQISRDNTYRRIVIGVNTRDRDTESLVEEIRRQLNVKMKLPPGYSITFGGEFVNLKKAKLRLSIVVPIILTVIFIILFISLNSVKDALIIYTAIPFAIVGGVFALLIRGMPFSISAGVGFIALFGVAVLNGLVLINAFNDLKRNGMTSIKQIIIKGTTSRLRPVIMTAAVAAMGFLPMAISTSSGAEVQRPLATVVIGGLITSTLLTLVVLPVLYLIFNKKINQDGSKSIPVLIIIFLFLYLPVKTFGQTNTPQVYTLNKTIEYAIKNSPVIKKADLELNKEKALNKTSFDLGNTSFSYSKEETDGSSNIGIESFSFRQDIDFPLLYFSKAAFQSKKVRAAELASEIAKAGLKRDVSNAFYNYAYAKEQFLFYEELDSLYNKLESVTELKYQLGETKKLETLATTVKYKQIEIEKNNARTRMNNAKNELRKVACFKDDFDIFKDELSQISLVAVDSMQSSDSQITNTFILQYYNSLIEVADQNELSEKFRFFPQFSLGYRLQKIDGIEGFYGFEVGVGLPLWFVPQIGKIQEAKLNTNLNMQEYIFQHNSLIIKIKQKREEYKSNIQTLIFYKNEAIPLANEQIKTAKMQYEIGDINYLELIQNLEQAINIKQSYLDNLLSYHYIKNELEYLTSNNRN